MTNYAIIEAEKQRLAAEGVLHYTGRIFKAETATGELVEVAEVEDIHTFAAWKKLGFSVKRGEHARAVFPVWKYTEGRRGQSDADGDGDGNADGENTTAGGRCYMRRAFWFTRDQVEPMNLQGRL